MIADAEGVYTLGLTDNHLKLFEKLVFLWADYFGVTKRWEWYIRFEANAARLAGVNYKLSDRIAVVMLGNPYKDTRSLTAKELNRCACHEVAHILLAPIADWAEEGAPRGISINDIEYEIVHTLVQNGVQAVGDDFLEVCANEVDKAFPEFESLDEV